MKHFYRTSNVIRLYLLVGWVSLGHIHLLLPPLQVERGLIWVVLWGVIEDWIRESNFQYQAVIWMQKAAIWIQNDVHGMQHYMQVLNILT